MADTRKKLNKTTDKKDCRQRIRDVWNKFKAAIFAIGCGLNFVSPFLTAVATGLLVWVAIWQWDTLEKTDQTNRAINRAFVKGKTLNVSDDMLNRMFTVVLENTGNTQAKNMEVFFDNDFRLDEVNLPPSPSRETPLYSPVDPNIAYERKRETFPAFSRIPLGARAVTVAGGLALPYKFLDAMAANRSDGYIYGIIWYDDIFPKSERHKSKFCFVVQPVKIGDQRTTTNFSLCRYWNCTDDECDQHKKDYDAEGAAMKKRREKSAP